MNDREQEILRARAASRPLKGGTLPNRLPTLTATGELIIPHDTPRRFRWWQGGQSIPATLRELNASPEVWRRYTDLPYNSVPPQDQQQ